MNLENIGKDCPCYEVDCSDIMFDIGEFCGLPPNNGKLTIQVNGSTVGDFSANQQEDETINITTPTSQDIADAVAGEALLRQQADNTLQANIDAEELARQRADREIQAVLDGESLARVNGDKNLQSQIDAIASKSDVVDVVGTYAELQAYDTSKLDDNDVVKVLDDSTHNDSMTYYRWNETTQTWSYIGQESPYYSKSQTDSLLAQKQDNLTAGTGITLNGSTISADTTVLAEKSELSNYAEKSDTYTKTEVDNLVEPKLSVEVVEQLAVQGEENKLYLTPKAHTTQTATGNPITATITDGAGQIEDFQLDGDTYQQSYTGKNLLDVDASAFSQEKYGLKSTFDPTTNIITLNGTCTNNNTTFGFFDSFDTTRRIVVNGDVSVQFFYVSGSMTNATENTNIQIQNNSYGNAIKLQLGNASASITANKNDTYNRCNIRVDSGVALNNYKIRVMVEASSTPSASYEPYVGKIASPNPGYPQPIQTVTGEQTVEVIGKNLFDKTTEEGGWLNNTGGISQPTSTADKTSAFITAIPNTAYTLSSPGYYLKIAQYDSSKTFIKIDSTGNNIPSNTITTEANTAYIRISYGNAQNQPNVMLEISSTATTYTPFRKQTFTLDLGSIELCKLGTYQDYIYKYGDTWKVHKATGKFVFTIETTPADGLSKNGSIGFVINAPNNPLPNKHIPLVGACSHFGVEESLTTWTGIRRTGMNSIGALWFQTGDSERPDSRTITQFFDWLASSGTTYIYALATATDTEITDATLISQLNAIASASLETGTNTLTNSATGSNLAGDMEVDYFGYDPTNRYDKWLWLDINNAYEKLGS